MERLVRLLAQLVVTRRVLVVSIVAVATIALCTQLPKMRSDPAPEKLISSFAGFDRSIGDDFRARFGDSSRVLVFLVEADDVLAVGPLAYQRTLALAFADDPHVERVDSITTVPIPRLVTHEAPEEIGLDELEAEDAGGEGLDELEAEDAAQTPEIPPEIQYRVLNALMTLSNADRELFPGGVRALGERLQRDLETAPIFDGPDVTPEQAEELVRALPQAPMLEGRLFSEDRKVAVVALWLEDIEARDMRRFVDGLRSYIADHPPPEGTRVRIAGLPYLRNVIVEQLRTDQLVLIPLTILFAAGILYLSIRWWFGVAMPLLVVACTTLMTVGGMALFGEPMNVINNIIPSLLIIIGLSCAVHIIERYREEMGRGAEPKVAGVRAVQAMTIATFLTSSTTAAGFGSNVISRTLMLRHFGVAAAIGVMLSFLVALFLVPPTMISVKPPKPRSKEEKPSRLDAVILRATRTLLGRPSAVVLAAGALLAACIYSALDVEVDHALLDQFDQDDEVYQTTRILEDRLTGVRPLEVYLTSDEKHRFDDPEVISALARVRRWALDAHGAGGDGAIIDVMGHELLLRQTLALVSGDARAWERPFVSTNQVRALETLIGQRQPSPLDEWVVDEGRRARFELRLRDIGAKETMDFVEVLRAKLHEELDPLGGVRFDFTGEAYDGSLGQQVVVADLVSSLGTAIVAIFLLLVVLFRSVRLAALAIPPNLLSLLGTLGYMVVRGVPLNTSTAIVFSVSLGLAVDGSIHVIARFREEIARGLGPYAALVRTARGTGRAIIISQGSLVGGFAVLLLSEFVPVRQFGELMSVTVGVGLAGTLALQPVLLLLGGLSRKQRRSRTEERRKLLESARREREAPRAEALAAGPE
jgi:predicted RND superfamily exporter protein